MAATPAELILHSGRLWDGTHLKGVEAVAVAGGKLMAIGSDAEVESLRTDTTKAIDVGGRRVMPGLIDSHLHMARAGMRWNDDVRWHGLGSLEEGLERIAAAAEETEPGRWLAVMGGWAPDQFSEGRPPSRRELDLAAPNHPLFVQRNYIEAFLNSRAIEGMGWKVGPSGRVVGMAGLQELRAKLPVPGIDGQVEGTMVMLRHLAGLGLTGCIDAGGFGMTRAAYHALHEAERLGLGFRARLLVGASQPGAEPAQLEEWMGLVTPGSGGDMLRYLGAGEILLFGAHDMEGLEPRNISPERTALAELSRRLANAGWPVHIHAILDKSVATVLNAWEDTGFDLGELRFAIAHADQVDQESLDKVREMGVGLTVQNGMAFRGKDSIPTWGDERVRRSPPLRTMLEMGIPVGGGTDGTVVSSPNPWPCIWWMVTGESVDGSGPRDQSELLTVDEALRLYTTGSAWFSFEEDIRGNLRPGSHADLIVLSDDPLTVTHDRIPSIESLLTIVAGEVVHSRLGP